MKTLYFNNFNCHNGDLHYYREFIKDIISKTNFDEYYLLESHDSSKLLSDIPNLKFGKLNSNCFINQTHYKINQDTYINIHFVRTDISYYILKDNDWHNYNSLLDAYIKYYTIIYNKLNIQLSEKDYYIPEINYSIFDIQNVNKYVENNNKFKVLICNGTVLSSQSDDINFLSLIEKLSTDYNDIDFILTEKINLIKDNVLFTDDIINCNFPDLNEISYLSTFCNIIIGRASGPFCFTLTKNNFNDKNKTFIAITSYYSIAFYSEYSKSDRVLINNFEYDNIYNVINDEVNNKYILYCNKNNIKKLDISRIDNQINFMFLGDINNIVIKSYIDLNNTGDFNVAYGAFFEKIFSNLYYYFIINRVVTNNSKIKLEFLYYGEIIHEIII